MLNGRSSGNTSCQQVSRFQAVGCSSKDVKPSSTQLSGNGGLLASLSSQPLRYSQPRERMSQDKPGRFLLSLLLRDVDMPHLHQTIFVHLQNDGTHQKNTQKKHSSSRGFLIRKAHIVWSCTSWPLGFERVGKHPSKCFLPFTRIPRCFPIRESERGVLLLRPPEATSLQRRARSLPRATCGLSQLGDRRDQGSLGPRSAAGCAPALLRSGTGFAGKRARLGAGKRRRKKAGVNQAQ
ncbi:Hypothetical predicted protein [Podarcis lilfordi]|uniref:Uncharacterized protein n=1 Tax=Podarcis lilfordi TaxID=74358 RepID=A0AA35K4G1_9SAUR|nr:Hypothetical predicted protein [Podarcis lilfordi]